MKTAKEYLEERIRKYQDEKDDLERKLDLYNSLHSQLWKLGWGEREMCEAGERCEHLTDEIESMRYALRTVEED